tara:strand:- start:7995 stop:8276 length:282 start_codon:yes stop_codon:yes gene_type:complete
MKKTILIVGCGNMTLTAAQQIRGLGFECDIMTPLEYKENIPETNTDSIQTIIIDDNKKLNITKVSDIKPLCVDTYFEPPKLHPKHQKHNKYNR